VYPGDTLLITVELLRCKRNIGRVKGYAEVNGNIVAQGEISFALVAKSEVK
jgi:3-hydroxyacyl-[acyl-carrier-protein] dehydratase